MFLEMSRRSLRARRFRSSLRAPPGTLRYGTGAQSRPRPPETMSNAEIAEIAECSWKSLGALCALGVSDRLCVLLLRRSGTGQAASSVGCSSVCYDPRVDSHATPPHAFEETTMKRTVMIRMVLAGVALVWLAPGLRPTAFGQTASMQAPHIGEGGLPIFERDPNWPKVPARWNMGFGSAVAVDDRDHVWILSRPKTLPRSTSADTKSPAPPVMEFDNDGNFVQGWGGESGPGYQWPSNEHGITIDHKGFVWVVGNADGKSNNPANLPNDNEILKFTRTGTFVMKIGQSGQTGSNKTLVLRGATGLRVHPKTNELFVSDGYGNARIMVFDADTGQFKRMWSAYGNKALDAEDRPPRSKSSDNPYVAVAELLQQFRSPVHDVAASNDGL